MKVSDFMYEMRQTSAVLGRTAGVSVVFKGNEAATDGKTVFLPALALDAKLTNEQVRTMRGYVDHEAGHLRLSDMPRIINFYKSCQKRGEKHLKDIHNCVEDVWMENRVALEYPGSLKNLKELNEGLKKLEIDSFKKAGALETLKGVNMSSVGIGIKGSNPMYLDERQDNTARAALNHLSPEVQEWSKRWAADAIACKNSEELIVLAKSIYKLLAEDPDLKKNKPEDFDPTSGKDGGAGEGEGESKDKGELFKGTGKGGKPLKAEDLPKDYLPTPSDVVEMSYGDGGGGMGASKGSLSGGYKVATTEKDVVYERGGDTSKGSSSLHKLVNSTDKSYYQNRRDELSHNISMMKNRLLKALISKQRRDWDGGKEQGRLDTKRLVAAYNRNPSVYKQRIDRSELDTAVTILVDLSGSMAGTKVRVARDCAMAISECLDGSGIPFKVVGFCNKELTQNDYSNYHRAESLDTVVFKGYNNSYSVCKPSVASLHRACGGNNSDYDFICNELSELRKRPESRKVLFVLSDGDPVCYSGASTNTHVRFCKEAIQDASKEGIECVGIGILSGAVSKIYKDNVVVNDINMLSSTIFNKLTTILLGR